LRDGREVAAPYQRHRGDQPPAYKCSVAQCSDKVCFCTRCKWY